MFPTWVPLRHATVAAVIAWIVLLSWWCPATARAHGPGQGPVPVFEIERIRLEGYLGAPRPRSGATDLTLGYKDKIYRFQLTRLRVLTGTELYSHILATVQPYRPNFILRGPASTMRKLDSARPGEPITITGTIHASRQSVLVEDIKVGPADKEQP